MNAKYLIVSWVLCALVACGKSSEPTSQTHIVGHSQRRSETGAWDSTVAITRYGRIHCTATLIAPRLVVTAAHCLDVGSDWAQTLRVYRGGGVDGGRIVGQHRIVRGERHPDYGVGTVWGTSDIAYLVLAEAIDDVPIIPIAAGVDELHQLVRVGTSTKLVGFGIFENASRRLGLKHEADATIAVTSAQEIYMGSSAGDGCGGDSGGPVFGRLANGQWRVFGVSSRGPSPCGSDLYPGVWGLMSAHGCWLEKASGLKLREDRSLCADEMARPLREARTFADECRVSSPSSAQRRTFEVLESLRFDEEGRLWQAGVDCEELAAWALNQRRLDLSHAMVQELAPLASLAKLEELDIEDNFVVDVSPLAGLTRLRTLRLGWNDIADFAPLADLEKNGLSVRGRSLQQAHWQPRARRTAFLEACLAIDSGGIASPLAVSTMVIKRAACAGRECSCYTAQDELQLIRYLDLQGEELTSLAPLQGLDNLQRIKLTHTRVEDLTPLAAMDNLRRLEIVGEAPHELSILEGLRRGGLTVLR